jgi:hypothetical protein
MRLPSKTESACADTRETIREPAERRLERIRAGTAAHARSHAERERVRGGERLLASLFRGVHCRFRK